jgi:cytochrome P450
MSLPKGPSLLGTMFKSFRPMKDHLSVLSDLHGAYGDPLTLPTLNGPIVATADPESVKSILIADPDTFASPGFESMIPFLGEHSILLVSGPRHKALRKIMSPPFQGSRMRAYGQLIREVTLRRTAQWKPGQPFAIQDTTQEISLEVIIRAVFGVTSAERAERLHQVILASIGKLPVAAIALSFLRNRLFRPWARYQTNRTAFEEIVYDEIKKCREDPGERADILRLLVDSRYDDGAPVKDKEILDQLVTMVAAGHETTATGLAWSIYALLKQPALLERLVKEVESLGENPDLEALTRLPYLDAVCQESLRLYPQSLFLSRKLTKPFSIKGNELPAGTLVAISLMVHFQEDIYPEPERFNPDRFIGKTYTPFQLLPFGGGSRRCIGAAFAMYEMKIVLATILQKYKLRLVSDQQPRLVLRAATVGPEGGVPVVLEGERHSK